MHMNAASSWPHDPLLLILIIIHEAIVDGPVGQVLARLLSEGRNTIPIYRKQIINKSTTMIFGLVQLVILRHSR